jgi:hypothetical protein
MPVRRQLVWGGVRKRKEARASKLRAGFSTVSTVGGQGAVGRRTANLMQGDLKHR